MAKRRSHRLKVKPRTRCHWAHGCIDKVVQHLCRRSHHYDLVLKKRPTRVIRVPKFWIENLIERAGFERARRGEIMKVEDVLEILAIPLLGIIPESGEVLLSSNVGIPVTLGSPGSAPAQAYLEAARRLEDSLDELDADVRVALVHYSPVAETLVGEPPGLFPFLGSLTSRATWKSPYSFFVYSAPPFPFLHRTAPPTTS